MTKVKEWCVNNGIEVILLGTVDRMQAAHRFYEKNGFVEIAKKALPNNFPIVQVDTKFYKLFLR
jgi:GNAT superfamily N-acetyltransferase